jgi:hypothetical protein
VAPYSTRSPLKRIFCCGSQATVSPLVWPRPSCISLTSSLPSQTVISPLKVSVGQVRPGIVSTGAKEAREALDLALHVGRAALDDQVARVLAGDDLARASFA